MSAGSETVTGLSAAAAPGIAGTLVLMFGFQSAESLILTAALIGGGLGAYSGSTFQMLRDIADDAPTAADWIRLALRVSASWAFGVFASLGIAALAGSIESVPTVAAHPFVVAAVAGLLAAVAPLAVPALQVAAAKKVKDHATPEQRP